MLTKTLFLVAGLVLASFATAQTASPTAMPSAQAGNSAPVAQKSYYWWLHPKLGMVKVDRATNAMLTGSKARAAGKEAK